MPFAPHVRRNIVADVTALDLERCCEFGPESRYPDEADVIFDQPEVTHRHPPRLKAYTQGHVA